MLRAARPQDCDALSELAWRSKAHWGYDNAFMQANQSALSVNSEYVASRPTYLIERDGRPVAFYALEHVDEQLVELGFLFVAPTHIGAGLGRLLLNHARTTASALGYRDMRIVSDPNALGFYQRMGAELWGEWHSDVVPGRRLPVLQLACADTPTMPSRELA